MVSLKLSELNSHLECYLKDTALCIFWDNYSYNFQTIIWKTIFFELIKWKYNLKTKFKLSYLISTKNIVDLSLLLRLGILMQSLDEKQKYLRENIDP
jgi:hypothetical protein